MNRRVLFIDDDQQLLSGIERRYGSMFEIETASSAALGLEAMCLRGHFGVVVTDMRMPGMDGLEFLKEARKLTDMSVFIMLTGNQDQQTASNAVNDGQVFRFLTKPCQGVVLQGAIEDGLEKFNLLAEQRELLHNTFLGSVKVLTEVLELSHPALFARIHEVEEIARELREALKLEDRWEYKLAVRLSRVGAAVTQSPDQGRSSVQADAKLLKKQAEIGSKLIRHIPKLNLVAEMVARHTEADGTFPLQVVSDDEIVATGASLVRIAMLLDEFFVQGLNPFAASKELERVLPRISKATMVKIQEFRTKAMVDSSGRRILEVRPENLTAGMILADDLLTENGRLLLASGARLSPAVVMRVKLLAESNPMPPIRIVRMPTVDPIVPR